MTFLKSVTRAKILLFNFLKTCPSSQFLSLKVDEMFENFKEKLQQKIDEFDWMQDEDKVEAKKKALQTQSHIGFPDVLSVQRELENMYSKEI